MLFYRSLGKLGNHGGGGAEGRGSRGERERRSWKVHCTSAPLLLSFQLLNRARSSQSRARPSRIIPGVMRIMSQPYNAASLYFRNRSQIFQGGRVLCCTLCQFASRCPPQFRRRLTAASNKNRNANDDWRETDILAAVPVTWSAEFGLKGHCSN